MEIQRPQVNVEGLVRQPRQPPLATLIAPLVRREARLLGRCECIALARGVASLPTRGGCPEIFSLKLLRIIALASGVWTPGKAEVI